MPKPNADASLTKYRIFETSTFQKNVKEIPISIRSKIEEKLRSYVYPQLRAQPYFGLNIRKLKGWDPEAWRYRIGSWRFFYEIDEREKIVFMLAASQRKDAY